MPSRSRLLRKKCKTRKFSYSHKSIALSSRCRRIDHGKDQCDKQYTPCGCKGICIEGCPCLSTGTCEKYCGYVNFHIIMCLESFYTNEVDTIVA